MAALTLSSTLVPLQPSIDGTPGAATAGLVQLPYGPYDDTIISSATGMNDGSYTSLHYNSSNLNHALSKADKSARGFSTTPRYGQIFPRTVYGN